MSTFQVNGNSDRALHTRATGAHSCRRLACRADSPTTLGCGAPMGHVAPGVVGDGSTFADQPDVRTAIAVQHAHDCSTTRATAARRARDPGSSQRSRRRARHDSRRAGRWSTRARNPLECELEWISARDGAGQRERVRPVREPADRLPSSDVRRGTRAPPPPALVILAPERRHRGVLHQRWSPERSGPPRLAPRRSRSATVGAVLTSREIRSVRPSATVPIRRQPSQSRGVALSGPSRRRRRHSSKSTRPVPASSRAVASAIANGFLDRQRLEDDERAPGLTMCPHHAR
jgi:hypothetical protein